MLFLVILDERYKSKRDNFSEKLDKYNYFSSTQSSAVHFIMVLNEVSSEDLSGILEAIKTTKPSEDIDLEEIIRLKSDNALCDENEDGEDESENDEDGNVDEEDRTSESDEDTKDTEYENEAGATDNPSIDVSPDNPSDMEDRSNIKNMEVTQPNAVDLDDIPAPENTNCYIS
jgi:hypothetical protein